jgi:amino acid adenylation domain-containing protein
VIPPADRCLHELVSLRAAEGPEATAVIAPERTLSYAELLRRAGHVSWRLAELNVRPDTLVAVVMDKGWEQAVAVLGILGAGAAYLPIDARVPGERLRHLLERGEVRAVVTQPWVAALHDWPDEVRLLPVAPDDPGEVAEPPGGAGPGHLAYVIFTSGSTGGPKGVMIEHRSAVNTILDVNRRYGVGRADRTLALSSLTFDLSVYDVFGALAAGGAVVFPPAGAGRDPRTWCELVRRHGVTVWNSVPALAEMLVEYSAGERARLGSSLRLLLLAGDWLPLSLPDRVHALLPDARIVNLGGATECAVWSTYQSANRVEPGWTSIPYGVALGGQTIEVLDEELAPSPDLAVGQMYIGGRGVARGYWREPVQTAQSFLPHPATGDRVYRTGDLGRRLPDGTVELIGREDLQVKVDGFRVEPAEIEAAMQAHPGVRMAAAAVVPGTRGARLLVGYALAGRTGRPSGEELRRFLAASLPAYMVPAVCVVLDELPLSPNGKVDRRRLPEVDWSALAEHVAPRSEREQVVAEVWRDVLQVERLGVTDDVFELGATSILATMAAARLRRRLGVEVPMPLVFNHPTPARLAEAIAGLTPSVAGPALVARPDARPAPLSLFQEQIVFLDRSAGTNAYNFQCTVRFHGDLDVSLLERALNEVVARHEVLRTEVREIDGVPTQVVRPEYTYFLPVVDLTRVPAEQREEAAERLVQEEIRTRFDVATLPLLRWKLIALSPSEHLLIHVEHHIVHDGWSLAVLWTEVGERYTAAKEGREPRLPELTVQYSDVARWQRELVDSERWARHAAFWRERLADLPPPLDLPFARQRPPRQTFTGDAVRVRMPLERYEALRRFARQEGVSLFVAAFAGFLALLHRYSGRTDLCVGTGLVNRDEPASQPLIGMLVNNVVLRTAVRGEMPFRELLGRVRAALLEAVAHQELPFNEVVRQVNPPRDPRRNPLVQVFFGFQDSPMPALGWPGVTGLLFERHNRTSKFDVNVICFPRAEQLGAAELDPGRDFFDLQWEFNDDLFDRASIERMTAHLTTLLEGAAAAPATPVGLLPLLTDDELRRRDEGNATARAFPREACVHELFEEHAAAGPERLALVAGEGGLTYGELNARANRLARRLRAHGVGPETRVALLLDRSPDFVIAALATLKAGGAYVPLDPGYPAARLELMLARAGARVVATERARAGALQMGGARLVAIDEAGSETDGEGGDNPGVPVDPRSLAYVIFTSGSTGEPKGVMVSHRAIVRLVRETDYVRLDRDQAMAQVSSVSFDACTFEVWGALLNGARLVVGPARPPSVEELASLLRDQGVTTTFLTAGLFHLLVESGLDGLSGLRQLLAGGDVVSVARVREAAGALRGGRVVNCYGPTESTTFASTFPVPDGWQAGASVPIGRPIANTVVHVLDGFLQAAPVGVPGELYIGGEGLARGYLDDPRLTASRFVPAAGGERLYRTGDVVREQPDGNLEFLGRIDDQVKVRGMRIEPVEIEEALRAHPGVRDAVVVPRGETAEERRLAAYLVLDATLATGAAEAVRSVRAWLADRLPDHLVPDLWQPVEALPLTANGKVDRRALPEPAQRPPAPASREESHVASPEEEAIAAIWAQVLGLERVGVHADFLDLGGHSLLATRIVSRMRDVLRVEVPLSAVFDHPTVAGLAEVVSARRGR